MEARPLPKQAIAVGTFAICLANAIALVTGNTSPLIVAGLIAGLGLGEAGAGLVLTCELLLMGIAATILATRMTRIDARSASLAGATLLLIGHGFAAVSSGLEIIILWRCIAGVGAGVVLAAVNATIAGSPNPARLYGLALMVAPLIAAVIALAMSRAVGMFAHTGAYGLLAFVTLIVMPVLFGFPDYRRTAISDQPPGPLTGHGAGIALLLGIFIMGTSMMAYFAFIERLGVRLDLSIERIGDIFAGVVIAGALGAGIAGALENRIGFRLPLIGGVLTHSAAMILALQVVTLPAYIGGVLLEGVAFVFTLTFQFAAAASLDPCGRWAAAAGGAFALSLGVGPYLGGLLIEAAGFGALTVLTLVCTVVAITLFWSATNRTQNHLNCEVADPDSA
jgi:predicted MFS family arabinose efflux permease